MSAAQLYPASTIAKLFDLTERRVQQLARDGIIPKAQRGKYPLVESVKAYIAYLREIAEGKQTGDANLNLAAERARLAKEQADKTALENAEKRKVLVNAEDIAKDLSIIIGESRAKLLTLPRKIAIACVGLSTRAMESRAKELVYESLTELARMEPSTNMGPTTGTHHKRVGRPRKKAQPRSQR